MNDCVFKTIIEAIGYSHYLYISIIYILNHFCQLEKEGHLLILTTQYDINVSIN